MEAKKPIQEPKFQLIRLRQYIECNPGGGDYEAIALHILNTPKSKKGEEFVIVEFLFIFAHEPFYKVSVYGSEDALIEAFKKGLHKFTSPPKPKKSKTKETVGDFIKQLVDDHHSPFEGQAGFIRKWQSKEYELKPWFFANKGERIKGDNAIVKLPK